MTRDEAKKKAEESAQHNNAIDYDDERVYELGFMACYDWMVGGEADGYGIEYDGKLRSDSVGEYYFSSGFGNEVMLAFIDRTDAEDYIETLQPTSAKIEIVPVKLITVEGSSK